MLQLLVKNSFIHEQVSLESKSCRSRTKARWAQSKIMDQGSNPFFYHHIPKNLLLIMLSLLWLPFSLALATGSHLSSSRFTAIQPKHPEFDGVYRKTIQVLRGLFLFKLQCLSFALLAIAYMVSRSLIG